MRLNLAFLSLSSLIALAGCGQMAVNGLRHGEEPRSEIQTPQATSPLTPKPEATETAEAPKPLPARVFRGDVNTAVTIAKGEQALFVAEGDASPVFHAPVTVEEGAILVGSAHFLDALVVNGSELRPVIWQLDGPRAASTSDVQLAWTQIVGGKISLHARKGKISLIRDSRFTAVDLTLPCDQEAQTEITWSRFDDTRIGVEYPAGIFSAPPISVRTLLRLASNELHLSTIKFNQNLRHQNLHVIEANNFFDLKGGETYFAGAGDDTADEFLHNLAAQNYFANKDLVLAEQIHVTASLYTVAWLQDPWIAGPGGDQPIYRALTATKSSLWLDRTWAYADYSLRSASGGPALSAYAIYALAQTAAGNQIKIYSATSAPEQGSYHLLVSSGEPRGCGSGPAFVCPRDFTLDFTLNLIDDRAQVLVTDVVTEPFTQVTGGHVQRQTSLAVTQLFGHLADAAWLAPIPAYTPYF